MLVNKAYRFELKFNNKEETLLKKHAGTSRFAYNWGLARRIELYDNNTGNDRFTNAIKQHKELNVEKKTAFPWMYEVSKCAPQEALRDLDTAYKNFIRGLKKNQKVGFPKFKKKFINDSFRLTGSIKVFDKNHAKYPKKVQLPRLGRMNLKEDPIKLITKLNLGKIRILSATVTRHAHKWYVNLAVEEDIRTPDNTSISTIGVDVGLKEFAVMSDGSFEPNSKPLRTSLDKLKRLQRAHSRKVKGSNNRIKSARLLARLHLKIANRRNNILNNLSTKLAKNHGRIVIEDLNVNGMMKNHCLAQAIADVAWGKFRTMLEYKCEWYGSELIVVDRFYPSSKLCSSCGWKDNNLTLADREFNCLKCGLKIDRDYNAAINLENYPVAVSSMETLNACGGTSVGSPAKQES